MKRLALFLDGTWNTVASRTNVSRLHDLVADRDGTIPQLIYYEPGVGTAFFEKLRGGMLGYGLDRNVIDAYSWAVRNFEDGDQIFIFGFSRGAFSARSVAGMIAKCGLLRPGSALRSDELFKRYRLATDVRPIYTLEYVAAQGGALSVEERDLLRSSRRVPIRMIGVWDTVGALGIPFGHIPGLSRTSYQFHHTRLSNLYDHAYQALAIDEHREAFQPTLWTRFTPRVPDPEVPETKAPIAEQRWFVGAHADVGGGNPTSLPAIPLAWLAAKAAAAGLSLRIPGVDDDASLGPVTDSFGSFMFGLYRLAKLGRPFDRVVQADRVEKREGWVDTVHEMIDGSVFDRWRRDPAYRPKALAAWARRSGIELVTIKGAVDAATGRLIDA